MDDFKKFIDDIGVLWALVLTGGVLAPVIALFTGLSPKVQSYSMGEIGTLSALLTLITVTTVWVLRKRLRGRSSTRYFLASAFVALGVLCVYVYAIQTFQLSHDGRKFIAGCTWSNDAVSVARELQIDTSDQCPGEVSKFYEQGALPQDIWTEASRKDVERSILAIWGLLTMTWIGTVSFFAIGPLRAKPE